MNPNHGSPDPGVDINLEARLDADEPGLDSASVAAILHATGTVMRKVRLARGLTITNMAPQCGVSSTLLCRLELVRREPRLQVLLTLCGFLGVRLSAVLRIAENEALPIGTLPWTAEPADLLNPSFRGSPALHRDDRPATLGGVVGHE